MFNDADIETVELVAAGGELADETCQGCGEAYQSVTRYVGGKGRNRVQVFECLCGHHAVWLGKRRLS